MAKRKTRRRKTFSERVMMVLSILIAISMILALFVQFGGPATHGG